MDAQTQDAMRVSEKEQQLTAPPGWTKKLVPASAKSITLRKYDVVFIAPDGQEVKSKWHLNRYLKAHPGGPASSEFIWSTGEEAPIRRSTRFATKEASEDNKSTSKKKGKRNASEMEAEEIHHDEEKTASRKRAKKAGKSEASDETNAVEGAANDSKNDEVMHEVIASDNEVAQADEVQKNENLVEVEASKEAVSEKATDEGVNNQGKEEKASASNATIGGEHEDIQLKDEGLTKQVEAEKASASNATIGGEHEDIQLKDEGLNMQVEAEKTTVSSAIIAEVDDEKIQVEAAEVKELLRDNGLHAENEQETDTLVAHAEEFKVDEVAMETEVELKETQETDTLVVIAEDFKVEEVAMETEVMELKEQFDQKHEENEDVSCKIAVIHPGVEEVAGGNDESSELAMQKEAPLESPTPKEDSMEPLMQKEEQERLTHIQDSSLKVEHSRDKSPSEFSSSPVTVTVVNE